MTDPEKGVRPGGRGRRGRRRVVSPATSGQPEELESQQFRSASLQSDEAAAPTPTSEAPTQDVRQKDVRKKYVAKRSELSPRDRWILDQRPPHWE